MAWSGQGGNSFLGAQMAQPADCSGETQDAIDAEVKVCCCAALRCAVLCHAALCVSWMCSIRPPASQLLRLASSSPHLSVPLHVHGCRLLPPLPMVQDTVHRAYRRAKDLLQQSIFFPCLPLLPQTSYLLQDIVDRAYRRAKDLVQQNISVLHECADLLMEREQIDGEDLQVRTWWGFEAACFSRGPPQCVAAPAPPGCPCCAPGLCSSLGKACVMVLRLDLRLLRFSLHYICCHSLHLRRRCWWRRRLSST